LGLLKEKRGKGMTPLSTPDIRKQGRKKRHRLTSSKKESKLWGGGGSAAEEGVLMPKFWGKRKEGEKKKRTEKKPEQADTLLSLPQEEGGASQHFDQPIGKKGSAREKCLWFTILKERRRSPCEGKKGKKGEMMGEKKEPGFFGQGGGGEKGEEPIN